MQNQHFGDGSLQLRLMNRDFLDNKSNYKKLITSQNKEEKIMSRRKDKFIDKSKAITFKLSYRDNEDPFFKREHNESEYVERVFEVKSMPMDSSLSVEERKKRDKLLSLFSDEDQGKFEQVPKEPTANKYWVPPEIRKKLEGKNLWIDQLAANSKINENDVEDYEIEELEDVEEDEQLENEEEERETKQEKEDEKEQKYISIEKQKVKKEVVDTESEDYSDEEEDRDDNESDQEDHAVQQKVEDLTSADFPNFKYKDLVEKRLVEENIFPKYEKIQFSKDVTYKKYNEYGLPIGDGFDYSKYFVQPSQQNVGVVEARLFADYKKAPKLREDIDYEYDEMTEEQKEVFEALDYDSNEEGYEELEDNFVNIATEGQKAIVVDEVEEELKEKVTGKKKVKGQRVNFTLDEKGNISVQIDQENPKSKKQVIKKVIKSYEKQDSQPKNEKNEEFDKVMKEFEDSYDEDNYKGSSDEEYDIPELKDGILTGEGFNKILDQHISEMSSRNQDILIKEERKAQKGKVNVEFAEKQHERLQMYADVTVNPDDIVRRHFVEQVPVDKDNALKSYFEREQQREENPDFEIVNYERPVGENKLDETIATKNFSFSKVHENLTIIGDDINLSRSKKYSRLRQAEEEDAQAREKEKEKEKETKIEQINEDDDEQEEEEEKDPLKIRSFELSHKIGKGEDKEQKLARKQALKEFKDARKQKKKLIKDGLESFAKEHQNKLQNRTNFHNIQNVKGISIKPVL